MCPKLKKIHLDTYDGFEEIGNDIKDDELFTFLQNEPHLEYIHIKRCSHISGSIYSKMGQFKQLKYFNVESASSFDSDDYYYIVDQCDEEPFKGDGILPHLYYLNIGSEMEGVNVDHLLKMAPNVKDLGCSLLHSSSNYLDIVNKLANRLTDIPPIDLDGESEDIFLQKWLEKTTVLKSVTLSEGQVSQIDFSKLKPIPSVTTLYLKFYSVTTIFPKSIFPCDQLKELFRVFPCVKFYSYSTMRRYIKKIMTELIKEGKWPNLRTVNQELFGKNWENVM